MGGAARVTPRVTLALNIVAVPCAFCGLRDRFPAEAAVARAAATTYPGLRMRTGAGAGFGDRQPPARLRALRGGDVAEREVGLNEPP